MHISFEVKRHRMSVTQGEAEVFCNGQSVVQYGDNIVLGGKYNSFGDWGSDKEDNVFIKAALKQYPDKIIEIIENGGEKQ